MNFRSNRHKRSHRRAAILILAALMLTLLLALVAFALDIGYIVLVRTQLQVAADSAAMSAAACMDKSYREVVDTATEYGSYHFAAGKQVEMTAVDVQVGDWDHDTRTFTPSNMSGNAVRVIARRDTDTGGKVPLFFARALGIDNLAIEAEAIASFEDNFRGFRPPPSGNLEFLPIALDEGTWDALKAGAGSDNWTWDPVLQRVTPGGDGVVEANLCPLATGAAGNRGMVDIGGRNNSTADLARQILNGVSREDLAYHGGKLALDERGVLELNGNPGISAGIEDELMAVRGQARIAPVFSHVTGQGNNATYTLVKFVGIRIVDVQLRGKSREKRVLVQPARIVIRGGIPGSPSRRTSEHIVSNVCLVR